MLFILFIFNWEGTSMILYFSGSGNSKFVAKYLAILLKEEVISLNKIIKENLSLDLVSNKP